MATEAFDEMTGEIEPPRQDALDGAELHTERDIARAVGEGAFLPPRFAMIKLKRDRFQGVRGDILGTERIVNTQKEQPPARALLNLGQGVQEEEGDGVLNRRTLPGARTEKIGEGEMVGVGTRNRRVRALKVLCWLVQTRSASTQLSAWRSWAAEKPTSKGTKNWYRVSECATIQVSMVSSVGMIFRLSHYSKNSVRVQVTLALATVQ